MTISSIFDGEFDGFSDFSGSRFPGSYGKEMSGSFGNKVMAPNTPRPRVGRSNLISASPAFKPGVTIWTDFEAGILNDMCMEVEVKMRSQFHTAVTTRNHFLTLNDDHLELTPLAFHPYSSRHTPSRTNTIPSEYVFGLWCLHKSLPFSYRSSWRWKHVLRTHNFGFEKGRRGIAHSVPFYWKCWRSWCHKIPGTDEESGYPRSPCTSQTYSGWTVRACLLSYVLFSYIFLLEIYKTI